MWGKYVSTTAGVSTMATYMVREGRGAGNYGYGSAVALIIFVISLIIALVYQKFVLNRDWTVLLLNRKKPRSVPGSAQRKCSIVRLLPWQVR